MRLQQCDLPDLDYCQGGGELFQGRDDESILSMDLASTGPPSLSLPGMGEEARAGNLQSSLTLAWGVENNTDLSSEEDFVE